MRLNETRPLHVLNAEGLGERWRSEGRAVEELTRRVKEEEFVRQHQSAGRLHMYTSAGTQGIMFVIIIAVALMAYVRWRRTAGRDQSIKSNAEKVTSSVDSQQADILRKGTPLSSSNLSRSRPVKVPIPPPLPLDTRTGTIQQEGLASSSQALSGKNSAECQQHQSRLEIASPSDIGHCPQKSSACRSLFKLSEL